MGNKLGIRNKTDRFAMPALAAGLVLLLSGCASTGSTQPATGDLRSREFELRPVDFDKWRDLISPTSDELAFERIPWCPSFSDGLERARVEHKPLLLWMMNGHPLGRT